MSFFKLRFQLPDQLLNSFFRVVIQFQLTKQRLVDVERIKMKAIDIGFDKRPEKRPHLADFQVFIIEQLYGKIAQLGQIFR